MQPHGRPRQGRGAAANSSRSSTATASGRRARREVSDGMRCFTPTGTPASAARSSRFLMTVRVRANSSSSGHWKSQVSTTFTSAAAPMSPWSMSMDFGAKLSNPYTHTEPFRTRREAPIFEIYRSM